MLKNPEVFLDLDFGLVLMLYLKICADFDIKLNKESNNLHDEDRTPIINLN